MNIFKFRKCNDLNFEGLQNETIYFSQLKKLNDIFEGRYEIDEKITDSFDEKLGRRSVCCLSAGDKSIIYNNHLMWTHYADEHKGFCIEYDAHIFDGFKQYDSKNNNIQENVWMPIKYTESYAEPIKEGDNLDIKLADLISHKHISFKHEKEIRLVVHTTDSSDNKREVKGCVKAIYLGCRISIEDKMRLIYLASKLKIACYQMYMGNSSYTLKTIPINIKFSDLCMVNPQTCQLIKDVEECVNSQP